MTRLLELMPPELSIVIPVYRSADCLPTLIDAIAEVMTATRRHYEVVLVNDYSPDRSWSVIESLCEMHPNIVGVDLRRNFGQDNAIMTGLRLARGKFIAIMDDDLQHHPKYLPSLLAKIEKAEADVVYADYHTKHQKIWKNIGSRIHGKIAEWVIYKPKEVYLSPYKVIRKDVADLICGYSGPNPHIDGLLFQFTSRICQIPVDHYPRYGGRSTYSFWRSAAVSARLAFSFSVRPLRFISLIGFMLAALAMLFVLVIVFYRLYFPEDFTPYAVGWASLMTTFLLVSGIQLVFFGVLGEYAGRTYLNINNQPQSSIREVLNAGKQISPPASQENVRYRQASTGYKSGLESIL